MFDVPNDSCSLVTHYDITMPFVLTTPLCSDNICCCVCGKVTVYVVFSFA